MSIDKVTLEYLFIQWVVHDNLPFNLISHPSFRALIQYINPAANQALPDSSTTITAHATKIFAEGKERLRFILASYSDPCCRWPLY